MMDEYPPGHKPTVGNELDELPVGGGGSKNTMMDEFPPGHKPTMNNELDELPIGGGNSKLKVEEFAPEKAQPNADAHLPLNERLVSKTWATRKDAYLELSKIC